MSPLQNDPDLTDARSIAVHPERTTDPRAVRWHVVSGLPSTFGPDALHALVTARVLESVSMGLDHLTTTLAPGRSWPVDGAGVRWALQQAVAVARATEADAAAAEPDGTLARAAQQILAEEIGPYAAGHGGGITLAEVHDGTVEVVLTGACHGCPAAAFTVQGRLEGRLRAATVGFIGVRVVERRR